jgi:hypothetical protein
MDPARSSPISKHGRVIPVSLWFLIRSESLPRFAEGSDSEMAALMIDATGQ